MKHRFLAHALNHTILLVDITAIGLPVEVYPLGGKPQTVPTLRFQGWSHAKQHLHDLGASEDRLDEIEDILRRASVAVLTIA
jgi:hypothetical protein